MKKKAKPESFIHPPKFPGGKKAMDEFIRVNLQYPEDALKNRVEGTVVITYDIDIFGTVIKANVKHGIGYGCDEEALRLVKELRFEKKKYRGLRVTFHNTIQIHFRLPGKAVKTDSQELIIHYDYNEKKSLPETGAKISYTIIPEK